MQCIHALTRDRECPSQMGQMNQGSLEIVVESTGRVLSVTPPTEPRCYAAASGMLSRCAVPCMGSRASPRAYAGAGPSAGAAPGKPAEARRSIPRPPQRGYAPPDREWRAQSVSTLSLRDGSHACVLLVVGSTLLGAKLPGLRACTAWRLADLYVVNWRIHQSFRPRRSCLVLESTRCCRAIPRLPGAPAFLAASMRTAGALLRPEMFSWHDHTQLCFESSQSGVRTPAPGGCAIPSLALIALILLLQL
jgi:hypothetical protein